MFTLSAFADEVSADLTEQMDVLEAEDVRAIELRGVWGKNVLDLTDEEAARFREETRARGFAVSAIGSPIGKYGVKEPFEPHLERFGRAVRLAKDLGAAGIRLFSYHTKGRNPALLRDEVMRRMAEKARIAEAEGVVLFHENEKGIYGETGERCRDIHVEVASPALRMAFDPANFVQAGENTLECWDMCAEFVSHLHVKDAIAGTGRVVPAGRGDGHLVEILRRSVAAGYDGYATLEPHLRVAGESGGETGPELFKIAADALKQCVAQAGGEIRPA